MRISYLPLAIALVSVVGVRPASATPQKGNSKCVSVSETLDYLKLFRGSKFGYPQSRLITRISTYGFCAVPTEDELTKIRNAGGVADLVAAIRKADGEPQIPERGEPSASIVPVKREPRRGKLRVSCQPVDCGVYVEQKLLGPSTNGEFSTELDVGTVTVSAKSDDYSAEPNLKDLEIKESATTTVEFKLTPTPAALERAGTDLFAGMIKALGGSDGLKSVEFFGATGILNCYDRNGQQTAWDFSAIVKSPDKAHFTITRPPNKSKYEAYNTDNGVEWNKVDEKSPAFGELDLALRRIQEQQIGKVLKTLRDGGFKKVATELIPRKGEDSIVRAEGGGHVYRITIGADMRPREILLESGGLDKGLKVLYSEYVERGGASYPMQMEIQYPDAERYGVAAKLRTLELNPASVKDADFVPPKKGKRFGVIPK